MEQLTIGVLRQARTPPRRGIPRDVVTDGRSHRLALADDRCSYCSAVDGGHVRLVVTGTGGGLQAVQPVQLVGRELDGIGRGGDGCLTPAMAWLYEQTRLHFGQLPSSCWDAHAWNPTSDHPLGKACDFTIGTAGRFPGAADRAHGWEIADWLTANAAPLDVAYVIWDGRIWSAGRAREGWRTYEGGGVYNVNTPTGGHYDHVHVSTEN